jgi:dTDP-4-dehydrorhamnose 3,5-epimerase
MELTAAEHVALHIPRGVAHGYQTLEDGSSLTYLISSPFDADSSRSLRWDDPHLGIEWPFEVSIISERDRSAAPWPPGP